jgi:acetyltransferase-like isoleucine patch superfamily enzyme
MKYKKVAGHSVSEEVFLKGGEDCSLFPDVHLSPEFWLSSWYDNAHNRFYPNRICKHWVTIEDGSVDSAISTWKHFTSIANRAGEVLQRLGLRLEIDDPLQRWLIVLHDHHQAR